MDVAILFLDIDGTVRHGDDVVIFPEAVTMMRHWKDRGGRIIGVSNQGGIALGHLSVETCKAAMRRTHGLTGALFDDIRVCPHHPNAPDPDMRYCWGRKPQPGLLVDGAVALTARFPGESYPKDLALMVGDRPEDQQCAAAAGVEFRWAVDWRALAIELTS